MNPLSDNGKTNPPVPAAATQRELPSMNPSAPRWLPIRALSPRHRPRIVQHLLALSERDRYLRFGYLASDVQIGRYVDLLDFERDEIFGVFNRHLSLVAMAHLAYLDRKTPTHSAEFGVSVAQHVRGRGFGDRLFERAALHARNRGVDNLLIHALSENTAMLRIAQKSGAIIDRHGPESEAWLRLPAENLASHVEALMADQVAEIDYGIKRQALRMDELFGNLAKRPSRDADKARCTQDDATSE